MISDLKKASLSSLRGSWGLGVGVTLLYFGIPTVGMFIIGSLIFMLFSLILGMMGPDTFVEYSVTGDAITDSSAIFFLGLATIIMWAIIIIIYFGVQGIIHYGYCNFSLGLAKNEPVKINELFEGFQRNNLFRSLKLAILQAIYIFLWSLLFIVPGIIKFFSYSMAYYILLENPEYTASEAIKKSKEMMKGHKLDLFITLLSFIGWFILGSLVGMFTLNLPYLWITPYYTTTVSYFYLNLANRTKNTEEVTVI
ncbi:DUF975 family protein [Bacillus cereus]|uniref:DUF975 family protein n=1 Tax=Bacillus cereus TaxID=1396 RepID=UPI0018797CAA|nr:DUF975 family protein [Bacillus cereus]MBE7122195.1 DUF975 family protein [Bacillus cereus]